MPLSILSEEPHPIVGSSRGRLLVMKLRTTCFQSWMRIITELFTNYEQIYRSGIAFRYKGTALGMSEGTMLGASEGAKLGASEGASLGASDA